MTDELVFRLAFAIILLVTVGISAFYRARARKVGRTGRLCRGSPMQVYVISNLT